MKIKLSSCFLDHSGYAQASRSLLLALTKAGVKITTFMLSYQAGMRDLGEAAKLALKLENKKLDYKIKLMMITPDQAALQKEPNKYNICFMFWEVLGLDKRWVYSMNQLDEIWTPSQTFADTFKHNGVYKPIKVVKCPIETTNKSDHKKTSIRVVNKDEDFEGFVFYSMFQWTERKNPRALVETYWKRFKGKKDVALMLKVYRANFSEYERQTIRNDINRWKQELSPRQKHYPRIFLVFGELSSAEIMRFHSTGDCFVSAHRGEGLGLPQMEAMSVGNPVISTNFGGVHEILSNENSWLIDYSLIPVFNMVHIPFYNGQQLWADANKEQLGNAMVEAYKDRELTAKKGKKAKKFIKDNLSFEVIGKDISKKLEDIKCE